MKKTFLLGILFLTSLTVMAQDEEVNSLFSGNQELKGFGALDLKLTRIVDNTAMVIGAQGGAIVNKSLIVGFAGYGIVSNARVQSNPPATEYDLYGGYGGLVLGFNLLPREVVHLSVPVVVGAGTIHLSDPNFFTYTSDSDFTVEQSTFFVAEPAAYLEFNVTRFFRLGLGASYRYVQGSSFSNLTDEDLSDWTANLQLKFGRF